MAARQQSGDVMSTCTVPVQHSCPTMPRILRGEQFVTVTVRHDSGKVALVVRYFRASLRFSETTDLLGFLHLVILY